MLEELGERAGEADAGLDRLHLGAVARDLAQADLVDLVGGQRQGRVLLDEAAVEQVAAAHVDEADAVAGMRQIIVLKEIAQPPIGGVDAVADDREMRLAQPRPLRFRHRVGEGLQRAGIRRLLGRRGELGVELADHVPDGELGLDHARGEALAEAGDDPVERLRRTRGGA